MVIPDIMDSGRYVIGVFLLRIIGTSRETDNVSRRPQTQTLMAIQMAYSVRIYHALGGTPFIAGEDHRIKTQWLF